jgi:hypothetical protein
MGDTIKRKAIMITGILLILLATSNTAMAMIMYELMPITTRPFKWLLYIPPLAWVPIIVMGIIKLIKSINEDIGR